MILRAFALIAALLLLPMQAAQARCGAPASIGDGWAIAESGATGFDADRLCAMGDRFATDASANVHAIVIARHGALAFEQYFAGNDQRWGWPIGRVEYGPEKRHDLRSVSKSVTSLLVGIAIDRGLVAGVEESVLGFFPEHAELRSVEKDRIRLRDLLTMSMGLAWDERNRPYTDPENSEIRMIRARDPFRFVLEQPVVLEPGKSFNYSGGATALLGAIVEKASGEKLDAFARKTLFEPLDIQDFEWVVMPNGQVAAASGLRLRPRDVAKLGQLFLTGGTWKDRRVVSSRWLEESARERLYLETDLSYGYQWWLGRSAVAGRQVEWIAGFGLGGQRLYIVPEYQLVAVTSAGLYASPTQRTVTREIFENWILAAVARN